MEVINILYTDSTERVRIGDIVEIDLDCGDVLSGYRVEEWAHPTLVLDDGHGTLLGIHVDHIDTIHLLDRHGLIKVASKETVNHPDHYQSKNGLEAWDVIEAFTSDLNGVEAFDTGNVLKYMCRWKKKNGLEDLKKAKRYLDHLINHVENSEKEND